MRVEKLKILLICFLLKRVNSVFASKCQFKSKYTDKNSTSRILDTKIVPFVIDVCHIRLQIT